MYWYFVRLATKLALVPYFDSDEMETATTEKSDKPSTALKKSVQLLPEIDSYLHLLCVVYLLDSKLLDKVHLCYYYYRLQMLQNCYRCLSKL